MRKAIGAAVLAVVLLGTFESKAADENGNYTVIAYGNQSCGRWVKAHAAESEESRHQETWVTGYITAYNRVTHGISNLSKGTDSAGLISWIDNYCKDNPLDGVADASAALVQVLIKRVR